MCMPWATTVEFGGIGCEKLGFDGLLYQRYYQREGSSNAEDNNSPSLPVKRLPEIVEPHQERRADDYAFHFHG